MSAADEAGQGRLLVAVVADLALFVLEIRHIRLLSMLDGQRWAHRLGTDDKPANADRPAKDQ